MYKYIMIIMLTIAVSSNCNANELINGIEDSKQVALLNNIELISQLNDINKCPIAIKIFRVRDVGECNGTPGSCPKELLYIAVSSYDEYPVQKLYVLPKAYGWEFIDWKDIPKSDGDKDFVTFEASKKIISPTPHKGWWIKQKYLVRVNLNKGYLRINKE